MKKALITAAVVWFAVGAWAQTSLPLRIAGTMLSDTNFRSLYGAAYDPLNGFAYFTTADGIVPGRIIKVDVSGAIPVEVASLTVSNSDSNLNSAMIDPAAGYGYFCRVSASPARILKVTLGAGTNAPTYLGALTLSNGENNISGCVGDPANGFGYVACGGSSGIVVKFSFGAGTNLPTRVAALGLPAGECFLRRGVMDANNGYAYFSPMFTAGLSVVKIALGSGTNPPTRGGAAALPTEERSIGGLVFDSVNNCLYGGTYVATARIVKVDCGVGTNPPVRVGSIPMNAGERELSTGVCDPAAGYALFGCDHTHPARVYKIQMTPGTNLPVRLGYVPLNIGTDSYPVADGGNITSADPVRYGELYLQSSVIDPARGLAWFGTDSRPGVVVKIAGDANVLAYDDWRQVKFSTNELLNANVSGATADPDGDGRQNLFEYATVGEPKTNDAAQIFFATTNVPAFGFMRRLQLFDTTCIAETTANLLSGAWSPETNLAVVATNAQAAIVIMAFTNERTATFLRLRVSRP